MKKILLMLCFMLALGMFACTEDSTASKSTEEIKTDSMTTYINELNNPYNVSLFVTTNLTTSIGINFEMPDKTNGYIEYCVSGSNLYYRTKANYKERTIGEQTVNLYDATIYDLSPNTYYEYRVVNEDNSEESPYYTFKTMSSDTESHSLLYLADPQETAEIGYMAYAYSILSVLDYSNAEVDLAMLPGDIVNNNYIQSQWNLFFKYSSMFCTKIPLAVAAGNHDLPFLTDPTVNQSEFDGYLNLPGNGPSYNSFNAISGDLREGDFDKGKTYSFDYGAAHIVVINTEVYCDSTIYCTYSDLDNIEVLHEWIKNDFKHSTAEWNIVMLHRGPYGLSYDSSEIRELLVPVLEDCGVDLVLAGHEHQYSRAIYFENHLIPFAESNDYTLGTVSLIKSSYPRMNFNNYSSSLGITYLTSNTSATKFYGGNQTSSIDVNYSFLDYYPVIPIITITEDEINVKSYVVIKETAYSIFPEEVLILEEFTITK
ncbi:MAG: metallophosphoesterase family protein [Tenericutes bacterium]|nr:metallophosphoesterase family protein [Mycoplasmatota bacterium]